MRALLLVVVLGAVLEGQPRTYTLAIGGVGSTDQESQECYFAIGQGAMLVLHPAGEPCRVARALVGRTGTLMFIVD